MDLGRRKTGCVAPYILFLIPAVFFVIALFVRSEMTFDSAYGFIVLRSMMAGGPFNYVPTPDPENIANNIETFLTWWSPGQYLVPGIFIRIGANYGLAISLTTLLATLAGVLGWLRFAGSFDVSCFVLTLFAAGLVTFRYATVPFTAYGGGDTILVGLLPWVLVGLRWAIARGPVTCFAVTVLSFALIFVAKLSGLVAFTATVTAVSLSELLHRRRITPSVLAMAAGSGAAGAVFSVFWLTRGLTPVSGSAYAVSGPALWFPVAAAAFSGFSGLDILQDIYVNARQWLNPTEPERAGNIFIAVSSDALGPLGLLILGWVWLRLRHTGYRAMAACGFGVIAAYTAVFIVMYVRGASTGLPTMEERYFYYAGIAFFLLLLAALDGWRGSLGRFISILTVGLFSAYGLFSYGLGMAQGHHYDPASGASMRNTSPAVLEYLRSQASVHGWHHPVAVIPAPEAATGLPNFRVILKYFFMDNMTLDEIAGHKWAGRADGMFVVVDEKFRDDGKAEALLKSFVDYGFANWSEVRLDGFVVYSQ